MEIDSRIKYLNTKRLMNRKVGAWVKNVYQLFMYIIKNDKKKKHKR